MTLTITPQSFSLGFSPHHQSTKLQSHEDGDGSLQLDSKELVYGNKSDLDKVAITSEDKNVSFGSIELGSTKNKIQVHIDPESKEVIIEIVNKETGEKVLQIPGEQRLRLSQGIGEYYKVAFNQNSLAQGSR